MRKAVTGDQSPGAANNAVPARHSATRSCLWRRITRLAVFAGGLGLLCGVPALAAGNPAETAPAAPEITEQEIDAIRELLQKLGAGFLAGDADACLTLFGSNKETHDRLERALRNEFKQSRYLKFEVIDVLPDYKLQDKTYSVDVHLRFQFIDRSRPTELQKGIENATSHSFLVRKRHDGSFVLLSSPFFETLGLRQGMGYLFNGVLVALTAFLALAFWVWMAVEAWRARPRQRFWRWAVVFLPVVGGFLFFVSAYLPRQMKTGVSNS